MTWSAIEEERVGEFELSSSGLWSSQEATYEVEWDRRFRDLNGIAGLKDNWDGEGAEAPTQALWRSARDLLLHMRDQNELPPTRIVPTFDGTVLIEWQGPYGYRECEITSPFLVEWFFQPPEGESTSWEEELLVPAETWGVEWLPEEVLGERESELLWQEQYSIAA